MRKSAIIPGNPWTILLTLEADPDSLGCVVLLQQLTMDGATADFWEVHYSRVEEALREMEMAYGIGSEEWLDLG